MVIFPYDAEMISAVRKIPNSKFDKNYKSWLVFPDHSIVQYIEVFSKYFNFEFHDDAVNLLNSLKKQPDSNIISSKLKATLRPFQQIGVSYAMKYERCFIADEMGLGKSAESIASVESLNAYPCIILCPSSLKLNWQREIDMWVDRTSLVISGERELDDYIAEYIIINYDILSAHQHMLKTLNFKSIVLDESHFLKNHKSIRTKASKLLASKIKYRFALTGTPLLNKPKELISQLDIIGRLNYFGGFWTFAKRYCGAVEGPFGWDFSGATNLDELNDKMKKICFIRRLKSDVLQELPSKQKTYIPISIDNRKEYDKIEKEFIKWAKNTLINPAEYAAELKDVKNLTEKQKKILIDAKIKLKLHKIKASEAMIKIEYLKQVVAQGKLNRFKEFIDNVIEQGDKLVVFASHVKIQRDLYEHYRQYNATRLFSEDSAEVRQQNIDTFQNDKNCPLIVVSLNAGGVGITLTSASKVAFIEFGWTPAIHDQAEDRCHRIGQKDCVNIYYMYGKDTIDEKIMQIIEDKRAIALNIADGISIEQPNNDYEEILKKFI